MGYEVIEFEIKKFIPKTEYEIVFDRNDIVSQRTVDPATIWKDYMQVCM